MPLASTYRPAPVHTTAGLPLHDQVEPARFPAHRLRWRNQRWAERVGLGTLTAEEWEAHFARFVPLAGNLDRPLALRYHGHQFRVYNPALGDGRGFLFAQLRDDAGRLLDLGTKGSGQTPWSRGGDGRLTLKGGVREVLATAMLEALGVPTSKSFSLVETGEALWRNDEPSPTRSSVLVRLSHSHVRFGTFQRLRHEGDTAGVRRLVDHCVAHYLPEARDAPDAILAFLRAVTVRSARLVATWMAAGFVHGVLNTDNMNVTGESFDYGPYRFLPTLDLGFTAAYFDHGGLYAYGRQPATVRWNLERLAETLTPFADVSALLQALAPFEPAVREETARAFCARLGVRPRGIDEDGPLVEALLGFLAASQVGFERCLFDWWGGVEASERRATGGPAATAYAGERFAALRRRLAPYEPARPEALGDPYWLGHGPTTLLYDQIEALWAPIAAADDWSAFEDTLAEVERLRVRLGLSADPPPAPAGIEPGPAAGPPDGPRPRD